MSIKKSTKQNKKKFKKYIIPILITSFILWIYWTNTTILTDYFIIESEKIPKSFDGVKIAHISDLHNKNWKGKLSIILKNENPDYIFLTGDMIDSRKTDVKITLDFLEQIKDLAPIYYVNGNHEGRLHIDGNFNNKKDRYEELKNGMEKLGITILENKSTDLIRDNESIHLIGLNDPIFSWDFMEPEISYLGKNLVSLIDEESFQILLAHRPDNFQFYSENNLDLVLSGHTHGGQLRLPFIGGIVAPGQGFFPKYTKGLYEMDNSKMIVSPGLGNSIIPIRFNNNPELYMITLKKSS